MSEGVMMFGLPSGYGFKCALLAANQGIWSHNHKSLFAWLTPYNIMTIVR